MKWEFRILTEANNYRLHKKLDKFGAKGWSLCNVILRVNSNGDEVFYAYLKRPRRKR